MNCSPCENCPDFSKCQEPCEKLERLLPKDSDNRKYSREIPWSAIAGPKMEAGNESAEAIDRLVKIDRGAIFRADTDLEVEWRAHPSVEAQYNEFDYARLCEAIDHCASGQKRKWFRTYLNDPEVTLTDIARITGTTKQNVEKIFCRLCRTIRTALSKDNLSSPRRITPYQFKRKYLEVRPEEIGKRVKKPHL